MGRLSQSRPHVCVRIIGWPVSVSFHTHLTANTYSTWLSRRRSANQTKHLTCARVENGYETEIRGKLLVPVEAVFFLEKGKNRRGEQVTASWSMVTAKEHGDDQ